MLFLLERVANLHAKFDMYFAFLFLLGLDHSLRDPIFVDYQDNRGRIEYSCLIRRRPLLWNTRAYPPVELIQTVIHFCAFSCSLILIYIICALRVIIASFRFLPFCQEKNVIFDKDYHKMAQKFGFERAHLP